MANPSKYTQGYDFSGFQDGNPATPLPADRLDTELANISASTEELRDAVMDVRRADGGLKNRIVTRESLASNLLALTGADTGDWVTATAYVVGDLATSGGRQYQCLVAHTSGTFATDLAAGKWVLTAAESSEDAAASAAGAAASAMLATTAITNFSAVADAEAFNPSSAPEFSRTAGYAAAGDGGGALYKLVVAEPSHEGKYQDAAGNWYELAETVVSPRMFGAIGDGSTDDTSNLQDAVDYISANGGVLDLGVATYGVTARIFRSSSAAPFVMRGRGPGQSIIKRISDFAASVMEFRDSDDCIWEDFSVDANHVTYTSGNHAFVVYNSERPLVRNVWARDWKSSGIIVYALAGAKGGARIESCRVDGAGAGASGGALVGILISGMHSSGMHLCSAFDVSGAGEGYGLELKNECDGCYITEGYAQDCLVGLIFGQDIGATAVVNSRVTGIANACNYGFIAGYGENNDIDVLVIMTGAAAGEQAIDLQNSSKDNTVRVTIKDVPANKNGVRIRSGCTDNYVDIRAIDTLPVSATACRFDSGAERNKVLLRKMSNPTIPATGYTGLLVDGSISNDNSFRYDGYPRTSSKTIATGVVTLSDPHTEYLILDTEGSAASDDLVTITGAGIAGQIITLSTTANARDVVVKHNTGNILLNGAADFTLDGVADCLMLRYSTVLSKWCEIGRGNNA